MVSLWCLALHLGGLAKASAAVPDNGQLQIFDTVVVQVEMFDAAAVDILTAEAEGPQAQLQHRIEELEAELEAKKEGVHSPHRVSDQDGGGAGDWDVDFDDSNEETSFQEDFEAESSPPQASGAGECAGCGFTVDFTCPYANLHQPNYFHRIVDCLVPMYGLLDLARAADGPVCILTGVYRKPNLIPLLSLLTADMVGARNIDYERVNCTKSMARHAVDPTVLPRVWPAYAKTFSTLRYVAGHPVDLSANIHALHRDALKIAAPPDDCHPLVLIQREGTRRFEPGTASALRDMLKGVADAEIERSRGGLELVEFGANMTVKRTLDVFTKAAGVVGYHGAGHANTLFTARPSCVMEISTYRTMDWSKPWRSNSEIAELNGLLSWHTVRIQLKTLLSVNAYAGEPPAVPGNPPYAKRSRWIKHLKHVRLEDWDVNNLKTTLTDCLKSHVFPLS